jgi:uncharacterized membrane protein YqaE (UPF0057 family)
MEEHDLLLLILAVFLPPVAVFLRDGCHLQLCVNIVLTFFFWIPGVIHAWWVVIADPRHKKNKVA